MTSHAGTTLNVSPPKINCKLKKGYGSFFFKNLYLLKKDCFVGFLCICCINIFYNIFVNSVCFTRLVHVSIKIAMLAFTLIHTHTHTLIIQISTKEKL